MSYPGQTIHLSDDAGGTRCGDWSSNVSRNFHRVTCQACRFPKRPAGFPGSVDGLTCNRITEDAEAS